MTVDVNNAEGPEPLTDKERAKAAKEEKRRQREADPRRMETHAAKQEKRRRREEQAQRAPAAADVKAPRAKPAKGERDAPKSDLTRRLARFRKRARGRAKEVRRRWKYTRRAVRRVDNHRWRFTYKSTSMRVP